MPQPTLDSCSFHHLHPAMKSDTAAPTANWSITTLRLWVGSSLGPESSNKIPGVATQAKSHPQNEPLCGVHSLLSC
jgi:hypothetical protein